MAEWVFWAVAAVAVTACLAVVFAPLLRGGGGGARRASYDMQVHADQLREVEADVARGILSEAEAGATRIEISRRLPPALHQEGIGSRWLDLSRHPRVLTEALDAD